MKSYKTDAKEVSYEAPLTRKTRLKLSQFVYFLREREEIFFTYFGSKRLMKVDIKEILSLIRKSGRGYAVCILHTMQYGMHPYLFLSVCTLLCSKKKKCSFQQSRYCFIKGPVHK